MSFALIVIVTDQQAPVLMVLPSTLSQGRCRYNGSQFRGVNPLTLAEGPDMVHLLLPPQTFSSATKPKTTALSTASSDGHCAHFVSIFACIIAMWTQFF